MDTTNSTASLSFGTTVRTWDGHTATVRNITPDGWVSLRFADGTVHEYQRAQVAADEVAS